MTIKGGESWDIQINDYFSSMMPDCIDCILTFDGKLSRNLS